MPLTLMSNEVYVTDDMVDGGFEPKILVDILI
jgi:hypothetical protein